MITNIIKMKSKMDIQQTTAMIDIVLALHKLNNAVQRHITSYTFVTLCSVISLFNYKYHHRGLPSAPLCVEQFLLCCKAVVVCRCSAMS